MNKPVKINRRAKIKNTKAGHILEVRIKRGRDIVRQTALVPDAHASAQVPRDCTLQCRETRISSGKATPWQTVLGTAKGHSHGPQRSPRNPRPKARTRKKPNKPNPKKKRKLSDKSLLDKIDKMQRQAKRFLKEAEHNYKIAKKAGRDWQARVYQAEIEYWECILKEPLNNPAKKAAKKNAAAKKPKVKKVGRKYRTCSICGKKVVDLFKHRWSKHRAIQLEAQRKGQAARRKKEKAAKRKAAGKSKKKAKGR